MGSLPQLFGKNLRHYRTLRALSQEELAQRVGMRRGSITRLESGDASTTLETISKLAAALGVEPTDLLYAGEPPPPVIVKPNAMDALRIVRELLGDLQRGKMDSPLLEDLLDHLDVKRKGKSRKEEEE